jgi:cation:H+ antiporter
LLLSILAVIAGLALLIWSADRFVAGAGALAAIFGASPLFIGMVIVGFGTSAPEMTVSALAAIQGVPELALGNAWGSNIVNIGLILGVTAVLAPIAVRSGVIKRELPILFVTMVLAAVLVLDGDAARWEAFLLLGVFALIIMWFVRNARDGEAPKAVAPTMTRRAAALWTLLGLVLLIVSSRTRVWGAVRFAEGFGVSELVIGLTVVAVGTSLPELASSIAALRRGEHELALGNIIGSNLFNTTAVVGIATSIAPAELPPAVIWRDMPMMLAMTVALILVAYPFRRAEGRILRSEGALLLTAWIGYTAYLIANGA